MVEGIENFFRQFGGVCTAFYTVSRWNFLKKVLAVAKPRDKQFLGYKI